MTGFRGEITDAFVIPDHGLALILNKIEGAPESGMAVQIGKKTTRVKALGRNSTDGQAVSTRSCLTGRTVAAYGGIVVDWDGALPTTGTWVEQLEQS